MTKFSSWVRFQPDSDRLAARGPSPDPAPPPVERGSDDVFIDWGPELPERYDRDYLRLVLQDPYRLFCYWELSGETSARFFPISTAAIPQNHLVLTLRNLTEGTAIPILVGEARSWWLHVGPEREYRTSLGIRFADGHSEGLMVSNEVRTPRDTVSWVVEPCDLLCEDNIQYLRLLAYSGAEPIDREFLELLKHCQVYDRVFQVPEFLLRFLPEWLREVIRRLQFRVPYAIFGDYILKRYFPAVLHPLILENPGLSAADFETGLRRHGFPASSSWSLYAERVTGPEPEAGPGQAPPAEAE